jgi:ABC-2 type transport system ATP-binding protein
LAADGRTLFVSSHLMTEMSMVADHLIVIDRGRVLADTSMPEFLRRHGRTYVRVRTPEPGLLSRELERAGATPKLAPDGSPEVAEMPAVEINRVAAGHGLPAGRAEHRHRLPGGCVSGTRRPQPRGHR